jgi:ParB family chromosome partitioning protein
MQISEIKISEGRRKADAEKVKSLTASIKEIGLLNAVTVTKAGVLVAGLHRLTACKELGYTEIPVNVLESEDNLKIELAEIDENLIRNELHWIEQGKALSRRKEIYELLHPETKHNAKFKGNQFRPKEIISSEQKTFTEDTAEKTGVTARTVRSSIQRAEKIAPELEEQIIKLDISKTEGTELARLPEKKQVEIIEKKQAQPGKTVKELVKEAQATEKKEALEQKKQEYIKENKGQENAPLVKVCDCKSFLTGFADNSIDCIITDPPYMTDVEDIGGFVKDWLPLAISKVKADGRLYICSGAYPVELQAYLSVLLSQKKFIIDNPLIWAYKNTLGQTPKNKYNLNYQVIWHLYGEKTPPLDTGITNHMFSVQEINAPDGRQGTRLHTWQKPDELANRLIFQGTKENWRVVDPFCCTGTFLLAACKKGRKAQGCDISKDNLNIAIERGCHEL